MTSDFTPLPQLDEGEYVDRLVRKFQSPPRWGRQDLVMEFEVQPDDFSLVLVNAYFQVKWTKSKAFRCSVYCCLYFLLWLPLLTDSP